MRNTLRQVTVSLDPRVIAAAKRELERRATERDGSTRSLASIIREWISKGANVKAAK